MSPRSVVGLMEQFDTIRRKTDLHKVIDAVLMERADQDERFGVATERGYTRHEWLAVLVEEVGEVAQAINDLPVPISKHLENWVELFTELVQVAAVSVAMAEVVLNEARREDEESGRGGPS